MKHLLTFSLALLMAVSASATVLRVNNSVGSSAPYTDLITAHAVATVGDTIYVEGSNTPYGSLTVTKRLVFIGPGYFLLENPGTPASLEAVVNQFILDDDGTNDPTQGAAGTEIRGLSFTQGSGSNTTIYVNDVLIAQCIFNQYIYMFEFDIVNTTIIQNYFVGQGFTFINGNPGFNQLTFANNIVNGLFRIPDNSSGLIFHNLFLGTVDVESFNGEFRSNIATTTSATVSTTGTGNTSDNTSSTGQFGNTNGNNTASVSALFVGPSGNSTDGQYQLLPTATQAKGNAHDGTDRGPFGGMLPYVLSGQPDIPKVLTVITNTSPIFPSILLNVTVRATSGN